MRLVALVLVALSLPVYATSVTDDFNRADTMNALGANWTDVFANGFGILSNQAYDGDGTGGGDLYTGASFANNQYAQVTLKTLGSGGTRFFDLYVRGSGTYGGGTFNAYFLRINVNTTQWKIIKAVSAVETDLTSYASLTVTANDVFRVEVNGTTIIAYQNGSALGSSTDSAVTSGSPGLSPSNSTLRVDDFAAGDLGGFVNPLCGALCGPFRR